MRRLTFGKLNSERSYWAARMIMGTSIALQGDINDSDGGGANPSSGADLPVSASAGTGAWQHILVSIDLSPVRRLIGAQAVIISAKYWWYYPSVRTTPYPAPLGAFRLLSTPVLAQATGRYRATGITWTKDAYGPWPGIDVEERPMSSRQFTSASPVGWYDWDISKAVVFGLVANKPIYLMFTRSEFFKTVSANGDARLRWTTNGPQYPYLDIAYLFPVEFFGATQVGTLDITSNIGGTPGDPAQSLYLGAVERGSSTTPKKCFLVNFSGSPLPVLGVWDSWPEWTDPVKVSGTGTGVFGYPILFKNAVSQKWELRFTSPTNYEVRATAFRDYATDLHSTWGGTGWVGSTASDWTAPSGGVQLPAAAFSGSFVAGDQFEFYVKGNASDASWPSDSAAQVWLAADNGGSPETRWWRAEGNKTVLTSPVTIDAAQKVLQVRRIAPSQWAVGDNVVITDGVNADYGVVSAVSETSITVDGLSITNNSYGVGAHVSTSLVFTNVEAAVVGIVSDASGYSQALPYRVYLTDSARAGLGPGALGFTAGMPVVLQSVDDATVSESGVVAAVGNSYIDLVSSLQNDYAKGSLVIGGNAGTRAFWVKAVASPTTTEELKLLRLDAWTQ